MAKGWEALWNMVPAAERYSFACAKLFSRGKLGWGWKIQPEQLLCIQFYDEYRKVAHKAPGLVVHIPNEGKRHPIVGQIMIAMGMIPGTADYICGREGFVGLLEAKVPGNDQSEYQTYFQCMAEGKNMAYSIFRTPQEGMDVLRVWGMV